MSYKSSRFPEDDLAHLLTTAENLEYAALRPGEEVDLGVAKNVLVDAYFDLDDLYERISTYMSKPQDTKTPPTGAGWVAQWLAGVFTNKPNTIQSTSSHKILPTESSFQSVVSINNTGDLVGFRDVQNIQPSDVVNWAYSVILKLEDTYCSK